MISIESTGLSKALSPLPAQIEITVTEVMVLPKTAQIASAEMNGGIALYFGGGVVLLMAAGAAYANRRNR